MRIDRLRLSLLPAWWRTSLWHFYEQQVFDLDKLPCQIADTQLVISRRRLLPTQPRLAWQTGQLTPAFPPSRHFEIQIGPDDDDGANRRRHNYGFSKSLGASRSKPLGKLSRLGS